MNPDVQPPVEPTSNPSPDAEPEHSTVVSDPHKPRRWLWLALLAAVLIIVAAGFWYLGRHSKPAVKSVSTPTASATTKNTTSTPGTAKVQGLQLDTSKNYGNKYSNGLLPVGDGKYTTSAPKQGYVYACSQYASSLSSGQGGASVRGPWFTDNNTEYNVNLKAHVEGSVDWTPSFSDTISGDNRIITSNDLPDHPTGIFPISASDPAYAYDRNPNRIESQSLNYTLPLNPTYNTAPSCMGGEAGVMLTGVALFNGFDAGGRDAGAWEVQDQCNGHPQSSGEYHYHTLSSCISNTGVSTVIGFALDGFPITGPRISANNILTTGDLDECHGIVSQITLDNKPVTMYHYVMTQDFPYSVSCFRGTPVTTGPSAGQPTGPPAPRQ